MFIKYLSCPCIRVKQYYERYQMVKYNRRMLKIQQEMDNYYNAL